MIKKIISGIVVFTCLLHYSFAQTREAVTYAGKLISVSAKLTQNSGPAVGITTFLAVACNPYDLRTAISNDKGELQFLLPQLPEKGQFILQVQSRQSANFVFELPTPPFAVIENNGPPAAPYQYQDTTIFYGTPDSRYLLDDYTRFATLEEVFREFIPEVKIGKSGGSFSLQVINKPFKVFFDNEPLILLDGVPVFDQDKLMEIDPLKLKSIEVVARRYYLGKVLNYGIISLFSFDGDMAGFTLPRTALVAPFNR